VDEETGKTKTTTTMRTPKTTTITRPRKTREEDEGD